VTFTVIGIVKQGQTNSTNVYIPLQQAQAFSTPDSGSLAGKVNTIYVTAASAADVSTVHHEISKLLPGLTVNTESSLANTVTGSISSAGTLANDLGKWLSVVVLIAAFTVASLLTLAAVTRRAAEFGTLKAIGWRSRRIIAQVIGECVAIGIAGGAAGVGLGFIGIAIITRVAPHLSAIIPGSSPSTGGPTQGGGEVRRLGGDLTHTVMVALTPVVTTETILLAVALAVLGGLLAGAFGSWRIARLRPAAALSRGA
jgi:putative ABC transport system permease protein